MADDVGAVGDSGSVDAGGDTSFAGQTEAAPSRADYLVGDYKDAESQARAYHQLHSQYGGQHGDYARYGQSMWQRYSNDPAFKAAVDRAWMGQQQEQAQQQQADLWFKQGDPSSQQQWWDNIFDRPQEHYDRIDKHYNAKRDEKISALERQLQQLIAHSQAQQQMAQYADQTKAMKANPYGNKLLQMVASRRMSLQDAVELFNENSKPLPDDQPDTSNGQVRGTDGRFARSQPNGRRNGAKADAVPSDIQARMDRVFTKAHRPVKAS